MKAKPELVVASALKPSAASTRAEPASHGFGKHERLAHVERAELGSFALLPRHPRRRYLTVKEPFMKYACGSQTYLYVPFRRMTCQICVPMPPTVVVLFTPGPVRWKS